MDGWAFVMLQLYHSILFLSLFESVTKKVEIDLLQGRAVGSFSGVTDLLSFPQSFYVRCVYL